jgi:hypothetical protein
VDDLLSHNGLLNLYRLTRGMQMKLLVDFNAKSVRNGFLEGITLHLSPDFSNVDDERIAVTGFDIVSTRSLIFVAHDNGIFANLNVLF